MIDIKSIWANQAPSKEVIVKTRIEEILQFSCFAATDNRTRNHIFIFETSNDAKIPDFKNFKFRGVLIHVFDFDGSKELDIYLLDNQLKDIFCLFIENIIEVISKCITENDALIEISNVILKWKKLFDKISFQGLSSEMQKGLIGELLTFNTLIDEEYSLEKLLDSWTGPDYHDKDFLFDGVGVEVKLTSSKVPKVKISSERQLDGQNLTNLFLLLYIVEEVKDKGFSLNSLVDQIRLKIKFNQNCLRSFNEKLILVGYLDEDIEHYNKQFAFRERKIYDVVPDFPKLTSSDLPIGLFNTTYSIELSSIEKYSLANKSILELIK